ncbi:MAG: 6-bladed beta-propeller [Gemmatimonadales bacterium]
MTRRMLVGIVLLGLGSQSLPRPLAAQARQLSANLDLRIEGNFTSITSLAVDPGGRIVALDSREARVYLFSATGKELARIGRNGGGPGEFTRPSGLGLTSNGFWVSDPMAFRVTLLSSDLQLQGVFTMPTSISRAVGGPAVGRGAPIPVGVGTGDMLLVRSVPPLSDPRALSLFSLDKAGAAFVRINRAGQYQAELGRIGPAPHCAVDGPNKAGATVPLCTEALASVSRDGRRVALLEPGATPGSFRIVVVGLRGDTLASTVVRYTPIRIPKGVADSVFESVLSFRRDVTLPQYFPAATGLVLGRDGSVWVEQIVGADQRRWVILDASGKTVGHLVLPPRVRLLEADLKNVWGVARDADDLPSIVRFRMAIP